MHKRLPVIALLFVSACGTSPQECDYIPIVLDNRKGLVDAPNLLDVAHLDRVEIVLRYHHIDYRRIAPLKLRIHSEMWCRVNNDARDTLWNMTNKANEPEWMAIHEVDK